MIHALQLGYLGVEVDDPAAFGSFLADVVGLRPGEPTADGATTWRNDAKVHRIIVERGEANDAAYVGFEATNPTAFAGAVERLQRAGYDVHEGGAEQKVSRRVVELVHVMAPWGVRVELALGLAEAPTPFDSALVPGGFVTDSVGFGHLVFATAAFDEGHQFVTDGLGMVQSDWLESELAPGVDLEVRFYHCNARHHTLALARAPFELPQRLHHVMVETVTEDNVGVAFDRAWKARLRIANGLGKHDNDRMFSFYVVTPAGFLLEFGYGARTITEAWAENRRYDQISVWGHQPLTPPGAA